MNKDQKEHERQRRRLEKLVMDNIDIYGRLSFNKESKQIIIWLDSDGLTMDNLIKISTLFKTKNINIGSEVKNEHLYEGDAQNAETCIYILDVEIDNFI